METIGDAFMVCGALTEGQEHDHTARVAAFAAEAVETAAHIRVDEDDAGAGCITVRAGFHSGPVVGSVVGRTNPRYCLFGASRRALCLLALRSRSRCAPDCCLPGLFSGDTVNTASRMESNSTPGRITVSPAAAELLRVQAPSAVLASRGQVEIKGKGKMELFFLEKGPDMVETVDEAERKPGRFARSSDCSIVMTYSRKMVFL